MEKNLLKHWALSTCALLTFLLPSAVLGQSGYPIFDEVISSPHGSTGSVAVAATSKTHNSELYDDCYSGGQFETTFELHIPNFTANGYYRTLIKVYRGDWVTVGLAGNSVLNEVQVDSRISNILDLDGIMVPFPVTVDYYTADFFSAPPIFTVTKNGAYRSTTTLQKYVPATGTWTDVYTTALSPVYGALDVSPFTPYGDFAEIAMITELNIGSDFNFAINGIHQTGAPPSFVTCPSVPLVLNMVENWMGNPGTSVLTVERGSIVNNNFIPDPQFPAVSEMIYLQNGSDKNLTSLFPFLSNYSGGLRITYQLPDDNCGGVLTPVLKTMVISATTASFLNDYKAIVPSAAPCATSGTSKAISTSPIITSVMPSSVGNNAFKCELKSAVGWYGAASAGITDLNFVGDYSVDVYEADPTSGLRMPGAPSIYLNSGTIIGGEVLYFRSFGNSASFNSASPFFVDPAKPADPTGGGSGEDYFIDYYAYAKSLGATALNNFSAKVFCVEVSQYPPGGCVVNMKSYFRIANNGITGNGGNLRTMNSDEDNEIISLEVYPNPTKGELNIPVNSNDTNVSIAITDALGKQVLSIADIKEKKGIISIEALPAGIYFYTVDKDNSVYRGKIVKQ
ncbi:MAG TPA: T9SS type A sorting domain-containing protein [Flavobacterium sp.]|nr:T9SS type A sorting domain-containing protein [Flavobacterium sp.]